MTTPIPAGFHPFWFWNDRLTAEEIRWQIAEMAAQGVKGFFVHPRQGLAQPYLSESFLAMVDVAVEAAKAHGLVVHLYDEYPYPSGAAGGQVALGSPRHRATHLVQQAYDVLGGPLRLALPLGRILSAMAYPLQGGQVDWTAGLDLQAAVGTVLATPSYVETGLTRYNQKRYFASNPTPVLEATLPPGPHRVLISAQVEVDRHKYWGHFPDVMRPEVVRRFLDLTHERYRARYGHEFGQTIRSIFTDEVRPGWSEQIPVAFQAEYGYDLLPLLPALHDPSHPAHLQVAYDLYRLQYRLFCEAWERPVSAWCTAAGLAYAGEKPSLRMAQLRFMDIPGCEPGHTKAGAPPDLLRAPLRQNAKATASAAYFYGKAGALDECYHSLGWSGTLQDAKLMAEGMLLLGIRYLVPHGFFYSTHALRKHDAPPTFFFQAPYWPFFGQLAGRVERINQLFEGTHIGAETLLVEPSSGMPTDDDLYAYERIHALLMQQHIDYHVVDTDILTESRVADGVVHARDIAARLVIGPPMRLVEAPLRAWLDDYQASGGHVIECGAGCTAEALLPRIRAVVGPSLSVRAQGAEAPAVWVVKRAGGPRDRWFALNTGSEPLDIELIAGGALRELPLDEGQPPALVWAEGCYTRALRPFESIALEAAPEPEMAAPLPRIRIPLGGRGRVCPAGPNLLRMYTWRLSLLAPDGAPGPSALVPAVPLANQLEKTGLPFVPEVRTGFGVAPELHFPALRVAYTYSFEHSYAGPVELVMEPGSIGGEWAIRVNGGCPFGLAELAPSAAHVRGSLGRDITADLCPGTNTIEVEVEGAGAAGGLLNPLYLAGDFGVELSPVRLVERPEEGAFEAYEENRLPFYAGTIEYQLSFDLEEAPPRAQVLAELVPAAPFQEACTISFNGGPHRPLLWEPRCLAVPGSELVRGRNALSVRVYTSLVRPFEGQWFDAERHAYQGVE